MRACHLSTALATLSAILSCGTDTPSVSEPPPPASLQPVTVVRVADIENFADARDLQVVFSQASGGASPGQHRVIVQKSVATALTAVTALQLDASRYSVSPAQAGNTSVDLPVGFQDADGESIAEGVAYTVVILTLGTDPLLTPVLSGASAPITLARTDLLLTLTAPFDAGGGGLETDAAGNIYHGDFGPQINQGNGASVFRIDPGDGSVELFATGLVGASGNAFDAEGNLLQANIGANTLSRIDPTGQVTTFAAGFTAPVGVTVALNGDAFVANCGATSISRVQPDGTMTLFASSTLLNCPNGLAMAGDGNLYASNFGDGWVVKIEPNGTASRFVQIPGNSNAHILWGNDRLYVVGRAVPRIYELDLTGTLRAIAGTGQRGLDDGAALAATISLPNDLALSPDGSILYFNDVGTTTAATSVINPSVIRMIRFVDP